MTAPHFSFSDITMNQDSLKLQDYYLEAKNLRSALRNEEEGERFAAAQRFSQLEGLQQLELSDIPQKNISLNQAKQVIAKEAGHEDWGQLKIHLSETIESIAEKSGRPFVPGEIPKECGEVITNDIIFLGEFNGQHVAVDAILMDVFDLEASEHGPGYSVSERDPIDFEPENIPDLPDEDEDWQAWGQATAKALGII